MNDMNEITINTPRCVTDLIGAEPLVLRTHTTLFISVVAYEHQAGIPARFCAGLIPAIQLAKSPELKLNAFKSTIRVIDPTPIANYCNGWSTRPTRFREIIAEFLQKCRLDFFFDEAESVSDDMLQVLAELGAELESSSDGEMIDVIQRIKESGRRHGGESGEKNALLYMAAHPFSWLDMHHPSVWRRQYPSDCQAVNLMSKSEKRFSVVRQFLKSRRPDLSTGINPIDRYMTVCNAPCYIPLEGEPLIEDLTKHGYAWCEEQYRSLRKRSGNHERARRDFQELRSFLDLDALTI